MEGWFYHFMISRPGKEYWITIPEEYDRVEVDESRVPFLSVVFGSRNLISPCHCFCFYVFEINLEEM